MTATNLMGNITTINSTNNAIEYVFALDSGLNNNFIISIIFSILIILILSIYAWSRDFNMSLLVGSFNVTVGSFIATLIRSEIFLDSNGDPLRLLSFEKFSIFLIILVLSVIYSRVVDK